MKYLAKFLDTWELGFEEIIQKNQVVRSVGYFRTYIL